MAFAASRASSVGARKAAASVQISPGAIQFTRTFGPQATANDLVTLTTPAFDAPYGTDHGVAVSPATLEMLTMEPPSSCFCMTLFARWLNTINPVRLIAMTAAKKRGDAVDASAAGDPPALFTRTSSFPNSSRAR